MKKERDIENDRVASHENVSIHLKLSAKGTEHVQTASSGEV